MTRKIVPIQVIQSQLAKLYGNESYYTTTYSKQELLYSGEIHRWLTKKRPDTVLDVGPAYGTLAAYCSQFALRVDTVDMVPFISKEVSDYFGINTFQGNIETDWLPPADQKYDAIILTEVLEHFNFHPVPTLKRLRSMLAPEGRLYLSTPNADAGWGRVQRYKDLASIPVYNSSLGTLWIDDHIWHYNRAELLGVLMEAGFRVTELASSRSPGGAHFVIEAR